MDIIKDDSNGRKVRSDEMTFCIGRAGQIGSQLEDRNDLVPVVWPVAPGHNRAINRDIWRRLFGSIGAVTPRLATWPCDESPKPRTSLGPTTIARQYLVMAISHCLVAKCSDFVKEPLCSCQSRASQTLCEWHIGPIN